VPCCHLVATPTEVGTRCIVLLCCFLGFFGFCFIFLCSCRHHTHTHTHTHTYTNIHIHTADVLRLDGCWFFVSLQGYCLSAWVDIMCAVLSGANWGPFAPPFTLRDGVNRMGEEVRVCGAWWTAQLHCVTQQPRSLSLLFVFLLFLCHPLHCGCWYYCCCGLWCVWAVVCAVCVAACGGRHAQRVGKGIGHFFGAWRVDGFRDKAECLAETDRWIRRFRDTTPAPGQRVLIPGDPERLAAAKRLKEVRCTAALSSTVCVCAWMVWCVCLFDCVQGVGTLCMCSFVCQLVVAVVFRFPLPWNVRVDSKHGGDLQGIPVPAKVVEDMDDIVKHTGIAY